MSVVILLMICSICVAGGFLVAYLWSVKKGQFDDLEASGFRVLHDTKPLADKGDFQNSKIPK
jgi:cbb3-type cytochrome oxidase maturation protein